MLSNAKSHRPGCCSTPAWPAACSTSIIAAAAHVAHTNHLARHTNVVMCTHREAFACARNHTCKALWSATLDSFKLTACAKSAAVPPSRHLQVGMFNARGAAAFKQIFSR